MRSAVTISLVPQAKGGPFVFWDDLSQACQAAHALGFEAVELFAPGPQTVPIKQLRTLLTDHGLTLAAVGTGAGFVIQQLCLTSPDAKCRAQAKEFIRSMIAYGGEFGAPAIIGSMQGRWGGDVTRDQALAWLGEALQELGEVARPFGVPLIYEPLNRYETNLCTNLAQGTELLASLDQPNVRLLADLFHLAIEEADIAAAIRTAGSAIGHVHFVDSNRRAVGFGHTEFGSLLRALREIDYTGYLSAEALPWPNSQAAAEQTARAIQYWQHS